MADSKVLVTGASGYIATHVVQQLQQQGYQVRGTVRSTQNEQKIKPLKSLCPDAKFPLELVEADLTKEDGWLDAVKDCTFVIHVASPFPFSEPKHEDELIRPAVDGTLHVLGACREAKCVKRVVMTSSCAAIVADQGSDDPNRIHTEEDWTDVAKCQMAYYKSKTLAEKAAWDFVEKLPDDEKFELAVINPAFVMGPVLCGSLTTSLEIIQNFLERKMPMVPKVSTGTIDVRDVATAHISALTIPEAAGHRHILLNTNAWFSELAEILNNEFKPQGYKVPTTTAPYPLLWLIGRFDKQVKFMLGVIGLVIKFDNSRMKNVLGVVPKPLQETVIDMAYSMIENGFVKKTNEYKGPKDTQM